MDTQFRSLHLAFVSRTTAVMALSLPLFFSFNAWGQTSTPAASSDAPKQEFYSAQDRQLAIKQASIFKAKNVGVFLVNPFFCLVIPLVLCNIAPSHFIIR